METVVAVAGKRTAFGAFGGSLKDVSATDLTVAAGKATLEQVNLDPGAIDHVVIGNVVQSGSDAAYLARHVGLKMGIPVDRPAFIVNRLCGSGFQSWVNAYQMIQTGEAKVVLAGGVEQMSLVPYVMRGVRFGGIRMGHSELEDLMTAALTDAYAGMPMAITAENLGELYKISREQVDEYSYQTQMKTKAALEAGIFKTEITPYSIQSKKGPQVFENDEHPKPEMTLEKIKGLKPLFKKEGLVTAATASGIVDGAACSVLMTESEAKKRGLRPLVKIKSFASVGCDPKVMGIGPAAAARKALSLAGLSMNQMDLIEVNEAFAAQYLAVAKELDLPNDRSNVNGGAIAIGHPLGASGTRIMNHLMYELDRRGGRYALGSACIGGGQGIAVVIERC